MFYEVFLILIFMLFSSKNFLFIVSDSCYHGSATDKSGPALEDLLKQNFGALKILRGVVPDEESKIIVSIPKSAFMCYRCVNLQRQLSKQ